MKRKRKGKAGVRWDGGGGSQDETGGQGRQRVGPADVGTIQAEGTA